MSKIGAHVSGHPRQGYASLCYARPALVLSLNDGGALEEAKRLSHGHTVTIFRDTTVYLEAPGDINNPPGSYADMAGYWYPRLKAKWTLNPADYYTITNEQGGNDPQALRNLVAYEREIMRRANVDGFRVCVLNLATGSPGDIVMWHAICHPFIVEAFRAGNIYGRHVYSGDLNSFDGNADRPIKEIARLGDIGGVAITECGWSAGYGFIGVEKLVAQVAAYDQRLRPFKSLVGFAVWELGTTEFKANWESAIPDVWKYLTANPSPPWQFVPVVAPPPPPPPAPAPMPHELYVKKGIGWLNLRTGPGANHTDIGDLHPGRGPLRVISKSGKWWEVAGWAHGDYLEE